jgi:hypothetical protein
MINTLITEIDRARQIMGLKPRIDTPLNEQLSREFTEYLSKIFGKNLSKEAAEQLSNRISQLLSRTSSKKIDNIFRRLAKDVNTQTIKGTQKIVADSGVSFNASILKRILESVTSGKLKGAKLDELIAKLPERLADGSSFRVSLGAELKALEKKVAKETSEKTKVKTDDVNVKTDDVKTKTDTGPTTPTNALQGITDDTLVMQWTKGIKDLLFKKAFTGSNGVKQKALRDWMNNLDNPSLSKLLDELKILASQQTQVRLPMSVEDLVAQVAQSIARQRVIPPQVMDDIIGILLRSDQQKEIIELLQKHSTGQLRRQVKNGTITDKELKFLLGGERNATDELVTALRQKLKSVTVGGTLLKIIPKTAKGWYYTIGAVSLGLLLDFIVQKFQELTASQKSIAGLTEKFYQKFKGNKQIVFDRGGLSDTEAEAFAKKLYGYLQGWMLFRDLNELNNLNDYIGKYNNKDGSGQAATSIDEIPNNKREEFLQTVIDDMSYDNVPDVGALKLFTGVADNSIIAVIKKVPSVLAMSQVTYFYNRLGDEKLMDNLSLMNAKVLPGVSTLLNWVFTTRQDVFDVVADKEWLIGSEAADDDLLDVTDALVEFWPQYAPKRYNENEELVYSRYKPNALISADNLERITKYKTYSPYGTEDNDWAAEDFQTWLDGLSSEEFNKGQCYGIPSNKCEKPYFTTDENNPDIGKRSGAKVQELKDDFTNIVNELYEAFQDGGIEGVKNKIKGMNKESDTSRNPLPNITEGLINILKNK